MKKLIYIKAVILVTAFLFSCNTKYSSEELVHLAEHADSLSVETATDVEIVYTDSAILRAKIFAPTMKRFPSNENPYTEMPDGVRAQFFGPSGEIQSTLTANYAISEDDKDVITIKDSVRVINKYDEEIKSNELIWEKETRRIYSNKPVRIRVRNEKILIGEGFESNESFTKYTIKRLTGTIRITEENQDEEEQ
ncbi:MAG: LPS export ABC transporter periplasmic protein LptC [Bacteroidia bacterium]